MSEYPRDEEMGRNLAPRFVEPQAAGDMRAAMGKVTGTPGLARGIDRAPLAVPELIEALHKSVASVHQSIEALEARLEPILSPAPPSAPAGGNQTSAAPASMSPVVHLLCDLGTTIDYATHRLQVLRTRLEV